MNVKGLDTKVDCPQLKKDLRSRRRKPWLIVTWNNNEGSSLDEESQEMANLCLMAHEDKVKSIIQYEFTFDELHKSLIN